jgi:glycosyltransferase involved in cell wall biosynthesis
MARMLMVLQPDRGGVFNHVVRLSTALAERGHEVAICGPLTERQNELGAELIPLEMTRRVAPFGGLAAATKLARIVRKFRPDLIHAHGAKGGAVARLARLASPSTPLVFTPHHYAFDNRFAHTSQRAGHRLVERSLARLATRVLCVCEAERRLASQIGPADRTRTVHNGIAPVQRNGTHPAVTELRSEGPVICTVAELRESKGIPTLVQAMARVLESHPTARLAIAGDGEQREAIEEAAAELGIEHAVRLLGATRGPAGVLAESSIFVNPAHAEGFPHTILEAMSMGLPIVATDVGGTAEAIADGATGVLVPPGDSTALATALAGLLARPDFAASLGRQAKRRFAQRFTLDRMVEKTLAVYSELGVEPAHAENRNGLGAAEKLHHAGHLGARRPRGSVLVPGTDEPLTQAVVGGDRL